MNKTKDTKYKSDVTTQGIRIQAEAFYLNSGHNGMHDVHTFSYKIEMTNEGDVPAQLVSRHWIIIDSDGGREEVKGPGVVGATPRLEPGQSYSYMSYSQIDTDWGTMEGSYLFRRDDGEQFDAAIARFYLIPSNQVS